MNLLIFMALCLPLTQPQSPELPNNGIGYPDLGPIDFSGAPDPATGLRGFLLWLDKPAPE